MTNIISFDDKIAAILKPISKKLPAGKSLIYDPIYDDIRHARLNEADDLPQGVWERPLKKVNWRDVEELCLKALTQESKDLQIMVWLSEAWFYLHRLKGMQASLQCFTGLCTSYWDALYPQPRQEDMDFRFVPFEWMDDKLVIQLRLYAITSPLEPQKKSYSLLDWRTATKLAGLTGQEKEKEEQRLSQNGHATLDQFNSSRDATPTTYFQNLRNQSQSIVDQIQKLNELLVKKNLKNRVVFHHIKEEFKNIMSFIDLVLNKREVASDTSLLSTSSSSEIIVLQDLDKKTAQALAPIQHNSVVMVPQPATLQISNREDAYMILDQIATYLATVEPHSPTPLLIRRAIAWGKMSLTEVLQELIQDKGDLLKIQNFLSNTPKAS